MHIDHPKIEKNKVEERRFQTNIAKTCKESSTLVVLPTGMGKTIIALMVIADILENTDGKVLFMAPTKPLVTQHKKFLEDMLVEPDVVIFTGEVRPAQRKELWAEHRIIVSTPQVIQNDIISQRIDVSDLSLAVFDESHRAVGDYAYVFIGESLRGKNVLTLGMTASPGSKVEKILEVCRNINIENVEIRSEFDPDVMPYVHDVNIEWVEVEPPGQVKEIINLLKNAYGRVVKKLRSLGMLQGRKHISTRDFLDLKRELQARLHKGDKDGRIFQALSLQAQGMKINHALNLAETQNPESVALYLGKVLKEGEVRGASKASKAVAKDPDIKGAFHLAMEMEYQHPKVGIIADQVRAQVMRDPESRIIVFTNYRDTADVVTTTLSRLDEVKPTRFVGQSSRNGDKGMGQKEQAEVLDDFRKGEYNVLVATSVGEEGLDIPSTDLVIFHEPIPDEIRTIQRRGRTGRKHEGRVIILMTKGTRDMAYHYSARHKEKNMRRELQILKRQLAKKIEVDKSLEMSRKEEKKETRTKKKKEEGSVKTNSLDRVQEDLSSQGQRSLLEYDDKEEDLIIIVDNREFNSSVVKNLAREGIKILPRQMPVGDYLLSERLAVERKTCEDFVASIKDKRLFGQLKELKKNFLSPLMIIEGTDLFFLSRMSQDAIFGTISSILTDYRIPIITTKDENETVKLLHMLAKREARDAGGKASLRGSKETMNTSDSMRFIVEGLPGVKGTLAVRMLEHFGSVEKIFAASKKELMEVHGIGAKTAEDIRRVLKAEYD